MNVTKALGDDGVAELYGFFGANVMAPRRGARAGLAWAVETVSSGIRTPVYTDRFRIGGDRDDDIVVQGLPRGAVTLLFHPNGEIWLGTDDRSHEIAAEQPFVAGGKSFMVRTLFERGFPAQRVQTTYPYSVRVDIHGDCAPHAVIEDLRVSVRKRHFDSASAVLLYLLARKQLEDQPCVEASEAGWVDQPDLMTGIWGPECWDAPPGRLHLLVCGVRRGLREAGFDPWCLEKRRGALRLRVQAFAVDGRSNVEAEPAQTDAGWDADLPTDPMFDWRKK